MTRSKYYHLIILHLVFVLISQSAYTQNRISPKENKGKWALVNGNELVSEYKFDTIQSSYNDYFIAKLNSKWGVIDKSGNEIILFEYEGAEDLILGRILVMDEDKFGIIDTSGFVYCEPKYDAIDNISKDSTILVKENGNWKYIKNNKQIDKDTIVFSKPDVFAVYGKCGNTLNTKELSNCTRENVLNLFYKKMKYPKTARENGVSGWVAISFFISPEGKVKNKRIVRDIGAGCGAEGMRVLNLLDDWTPAFVDGKPVWSSFTLPLKFRLK